MGGIFECVMLLNGKPHVICIACQFKEEHDGSKVDYVGIIEEILEVDFKSFKTLFLKVQWFHNTTQLEDCLFCSIDTSKFFGDGCMNGQPFVFPNEVEQVFLAKDKLNPKAKELLGFRCFIIMFLDGHYTRITIKILQIRLHLSKEKKNMLTQTNRKTKHHLVIALDQNFATRM